MAAPTLKLPEIPESEQTPWVQELLRLLVEYQKRIAELEEEIKRLKGHPRKPKIHASRMDQEAGQDQDNEEKLKGSRGPQRAKTAELIKHEERVIAPEGLPADARERGYRFKGYADYGVQDWVIEAHSVRYRLEQWQSPDGQMLKGRLPDEVKGHFGATLKSYVLYQSHHQHVTQPLLHEQLRALGIEISAGQLNHLLSEDPKAFHEEKAQVLEAGLQGSTHIQTDDTGARHQGRNGYCTYIGNELFAWFESTENKSRVNFLSLLRAGHEDHVLNAGALDYMGRHKLPRAQRDRLEEGRRFAEQGEWEAYLREVGLVDPRHVRIATEGALMGSLLEHGISAQLGIGSSDAGQFNVFRHALCWIHLERTITELIPLNPTQAKHMEWVRCQIWDLYADLKAYKTDSSLQTAAFREEIRARFDELCRTRTAYQTLNERLKRMVRNKAELFQVLDDPALPLHNNLSESDIREYVRRRKISGSTRSDEGRRCRDTFASLKKTCRKLGISFWQYLRDRLSRANRIPPLSDCVRNAAART
jgi:hypothetical protein